MKLLYVVL